MAITVVRRTGRSSQACAALHSAQGELAQEQRLRVFESVALAATTLSKSRIGPMNALRLVAAVIGMLIALALVPEPTPEIATTDLSLAALEVTPAPAPVGLLAATAAIQTTRPTGYIGRDVKSPDGSPIGHITDVVLDANGQATQVIVVPALAAGSDAAPVAVPWSSVMGLDEDHSSVVISPLIHEASPLPAPEPEAPAST